MEHPSLSLKQSEEEVQRVAAEFLDKVRPIVENRKHIKEANEEIVGLLRQTVLKLDELVSLKNVNAAAEAEVLKLLKLELNR